MTSIIYAHNYIAYKYCKTRKKYDDKILRKCSQAVFTTIKIHESCI